MRFGLRIRESRSSTDEELLNEFRSDGDLRVLGELYSGYARLVYGVCLKYLKNNEEAKDGVMQIFEKLITEIPRHDIVNFRSWLHVVAKNYCLMQIRSTRSDKEKFNEWLNDPEIFMENPVELHPLDEGEEAQAAMNAAIEDCIKKLNEDQRSCIRQFYFEDRCYREISGNLGMDEKKVKSHLQNGKRNLKICLEQKNVRKE